MEKIKYLVAEKCYMENSLCFDFQGSFMNEFRKENIILYVRTKFNENSGQDEDDMSDSNCVYRYEDLYLRICPETLDRESRQTFESCEYELKYCFTEDRKKELVTFSCPTLIGLDDLYVGYRDLSSLIQKKINNYIS